MRQKFRETLETYGHIAKGEMAEKDDPRLKDVKDWNLDFAAGEQRTTKRTQQEIFALQRRKQKIMAKLKEAIRNLDNPDYKPKPTENQRFVVKLDGQYFWQTEKGKLRKITFGDLMTDADWGINYFLDPITVPKLDRKKFLIESAKQELQDLLDRQIVLAEVDREGLPSGIKKAYENWLISKESKAENWGLIAEKMVKNFLQKLTYDFDVDFMIEEADIFQDITQKVDFIIRRKFRRRGVNVQIGAENLGVQFTIDSRAVERKQHQIEKSKKYQRDEKVFTDIVLVTLPLKSMKKVYNLWKENSMPPGGPDKIWSMETKEEIFRAILKDIFTPEEIGSGFYPRRVLTNSGRLDTLPRRWMRKPYLGV